MKDFGFKISEKKKKEGRYCCAIACKNAPEYKKGGLCHKHYRRKRRKLDPVAVRYNDFKFNALRRGKDFDFSLSEFRKFCDDTGYIIQKGRRGLAATVDRIRNYEGYNPNNVQLLTITANINKYHEQDKHEECPF